MSSTAQVCVLCAKYRARWCRSSSCFLCVVLSQQQTVNDLLATVLRTKKKKKKSAPNPTLLLWLTGCCGSASSCASETNSSGSTNDEVVVQHHKDFAYRDFRSELRLGYARRAVNGPVQPRTKSPAGEKRFGPRALLVLWPRVRFYHFLFL